MRQNVEYASESETDAGGRLSALWRTGGRGLVPALLAFLCAGAATLGVALSRPAVNSGRAPSVPSASVGQRVAVDQGTASWASDPELDFAASWSG